MLPPRLGLSWALLLAWSLPLCSAWGSSSHGWGRGPCEAYIWSWLAFPAAWQTWEGQPAPWQVFGSTSMGGIQAAWSSALSVWLILQAKSSSLWCIGPSQRVEWIRRVDAQKPQKSCPVLGGYMWRWWSHNTAFLATLQKGWSALLCTQMDYYFDVMKKHPAGKVQPKIKSLICDLHFNSQPAFLVFWPNHAHWLLKLALWIQKTLYLFQEHFYLS